jgi:hypothetical protein
MDRDGRPRLTVVGHGLQFCVVAHALMIARAGIGKSLIPTLLWWSLLKKTYPQLVNGRAEYPVERLAGLKAKADEVWSSLRSAEAFHAFDHYSEKGGPD